MSSHDGKDLYVNARRIAIAGCTGAVGRSLLQLIEERVFPTSELRLMASARSAGTAVTALGRTTVVEDLATADFTGTDIAFFSAGTAVSAQWAAKAAAAGALVVDNTNAFRMDLDSPLVVPQVNGALLAERPVSGIVANPNCSTIPLVRLLQPMHEAYGLRRVTAATYQAASGGGQSGIEELRAGSRNVLEGWPAAAERFPEPLAFNVVPAIDRFQDDGSTLEERKMRQESRRILELPSLDLTATCVRVPVENGHSEAVVVDCEHPVTAAGLTELFAAQPEVEVWTDRVPTPRTVTARPDHVHVGRVRVDPEQPTRALFWLVADNLRIGAALNALQIAERAVEEGIV
ncbi:aspartate-semialdehyde dehydrogenase [Streptomyces sp. TRM68367]|uniref:aspartate-semialdehyde dehydrogenase n=1 Tax=Streptomyces sp. TRM68367 TaxID=2758415 RepID=UPI00165C741E|nr:aspartate-semialdehyde dehydrogenase [Streptomyces sp. TRM68367]MBC9726547.1 aspartate-semialdehyde dehydrogenase [Streptomyces sp. TRM68367]